MPLKRLIYYLTQPDIAWGNPQEGPMGTIAGRGVIRPVVNCLKPENGNRASLEVCYECDEFCAAAEHYVECGHQQSQQERDAIERNRFGTSAVKRPVVPIGPEVKEMPVPKGVFVPPKK